LHDAAVVDSEPMVIVSDVPPREKYSAPRVRHDVGFEEAVRTLMDRAIRKVVYLPSRGVYRRRADITLPRSTILVMPRLYGNMFEMIRRRHVR